MSELPPEYLDSRTPPDVIVTDRIPPPVDDPTLGEPLGDPLPDAVPLPATPAHPLVSIGDSLTHGMSSGAVFRTDLAWPVLAAGCLGVQRLKAPSYAGPLGGLPVNIEGLLRQLQKQLGADLNVWDILRFPVVLQRLLDKNEDYWERGEGRRPPRTDIRYENLGIYGWDVRDALSYTAGLAATRASEAPDDSFLGAKPDHDNDIAASSVLAPFGIHSAQIDAAAWHGQNGGIDTLVVALGANNALGSVVNKNVRWSDAGFDDLRRKRSYNVWRPTHFALEFGQLLRSLRPIAARRVVLVTVPHVTIAPIAQGVNPDNPGQKWREGSRYFPYYTDPWVPEKDFRPSKHRYLTHQQARAVDSAIDQFNDTIVGAVRSARREGRDWLVLDLCGVLDGLAYRRFKRDDDAAERNQWVQYKLPPPIADLDTRFFLSDKRGRRQGGLFSLDAVHPTTSGYGVIAQALLDTLAAAGVSSTPLDFTALRAKDTLNADPPALLGPVLKLATPFLSRFVTQSS